MGDIKEIILLFVDVPAFIFHVSMVVFLSVKIYKNACAFKSGFYKLFLLVGISDSFWYLHVIVI
jgi:hypothetical protein